MIARPRPRNFISIVLPGATAILLIASAPCIGATEPTPAAALKALFDEAWERDLREDPLRASFVGDRRYDKLWPDLSATALARTAREDATTLERLHAIDRNRLEPGDRLNYDLFEREYRHRIEVRRFKPEMYQTLTSGSGLHTAWEITESLPFATAQDYEAWIARLDALKLYIEQGTAILVQGMREKRMPPRVLLQRVIQPLAMLVSSTVDDNPFFEPFKRMPESIAAGERARLADAGRKAIEGRVIPAYGRLNEFFLEHYLPAAREAVGIWSTPDGDAYYRERIAYHTTINLAPDAIHELGLKEVARIHAEMEGIIEQVKFTGGFAAFLHYLRTEPNFYYQTPEELLEAYLATAKRIDPELVKLFRILPRTPYGVRAIPAAAAPNETAAYYSSPAADGSRAGYYSVNLYLPQTRPKYEIEALTAHEAVPGHHLQIALAQEQKELPAFRRQLGIGAYTEGWALYAESLGEDLGLYRDPYSKFGQLTFEMWRALRLVVDTGIHYKHWTRQQAIDYLLANAAKPEANIVNEVDRYISIPGQALAYKIGQLKLLELRQEAERRLGAKFDIRDFHGVVLESGAVPLDILERRIREWIEAGGPEKHSP